MKTSGKEICDEECRSCALFFCLIDDKKLCKEDCDDCELPACESCEFAGYSNWEPCRTCCHLEWFSKQRNHYIKEDDTNAKG